MVAKVIGETLPFGASNIEPFLEAAGLKPQEETNSQPIHSNASYTHDCYTNVMIYPNPAKDRETAEYPYVDLFRDFAAALCRPNHTLFCYGYSFGDEHINRVIQDMLTIPSTHLVIISFDDNSGRILKKFEEWGKKEQMTLIVGKDVADLSELTKYYLPKPAIDRNTLKLHEIMRNRFNQLPQHNETLNLQD